MNARMIGLSLALVASFSGTAVADEVCRPCPFNCQQLGIRHDDCSNRGSRYGQCCVDLDNDGFRKLRDFDRYGPRGRFDDVRWRDRWGDRDRNDDWRHRDRYRHDRGRDWWWSRDNDYDRRDRWGRSHGDKPGEIQGDCPDGYHYNDRKCTDDERRRGCSDLRSPSGRLCVGWRR